MNNQNNMKFFVASVIIVFCGVLYLFKPFLLPIIIGILMAVSTASIQAYFLKVTKNRKMLSSILSTVFIVLIFFSPFIYISLTLGSKLFSLNMKDVTDMVNTVTNYKFNFPEHFKFLEPDLKGMINSINIQNLISKSVDFISQIGKKVGVFAFDMILIIVFYFFANFYGSDLIKFLKSTLPMDGEDLEVVLGEVSNTMSVVFYSTVANVILQGCLFAFITTIFGFDGLLMGIIYAFCTLIPMIGGLIVYVPISLYEVFQGHMISGVIIFVYSAVVISFGADSIVKPLVIKFINRKLVKKPANINELLIFFAMLAGIATFGFWGLILGPAILTLFLSIINLYSLLKERDYN